MHGVRNGDLRGRRGSAPAVAGDHDRTRVHEPQDDLLEEERISLGRLDDGASENVGYVRRGKQPAHERGCLCLRQGLERDRRHAFAPGAEAGVSVHELGSGRGDDQQRPCRAGHEAVQHLDQRLTRPMKILDDEDRRSSRGKRRGEARPRSPELVGDGARLEAVERIVRRCEAGSRRQRIRRVLELGVGETQRREQDTRAGEQRLAGAAGGHVERDAERIPEDLGERPECDSASGRQATARVHRELGSRLACRSEELRDESALADPRRPEHEAEPRRCRLHRLVEELLQLRKLAPAPDERRSACSRQLRREVRSAQPVREDRGAHALELEGERIFEVERVACRCEGPIADEHGARLGRLLQASRDVDCLAGDEPLVALRCDRGDHLARVDSDPHRQCDAMPLAEAFVQLLEPVDHLERGPKCAVGVVLVRRRNAEDGDDHVSDVLLHRPAPRGDDLGHRLEVDADERVQALGVERHAERRRANHVSEDDRRELPLRVGARSGLSPLPPRLHERCLPTRVDLERRILIQDLPLELAKRRRGLDPELVDEGAPRLLIRRQRFGLAAAAIEREHQLAA